MPVSSLMQSNDCAEVSDNSLLGKSLKDTLVDVGCDMVDVHCCVESDLTFEEELAKNNNINMLSSCRTVLIFSAKVQKNSASPKHPLEVADPSEEVLHKIDASDDLTKHDTVVVKIILFRG